MDLYVDVEGLGIRGHDAAEAAIELEESDGGVWSSILEDLGKTDLRVLAWSPRASVARFGAQVLQAFCANCHAATVQPTGVRVLNREGVFRFARRTSWVVDCYSLVQSVPGRQHAPLLIADCYPRHETLFRHVIEVRLTPTFEEVYFVVDRRRQCAKLQMAHRRFPVQLQAYVERVARSSRQPHVLLPSGENGGEDRFRLVGVA